MRADRLRRAQAPRERVAVVAGGAARRRRSIIGPWKVTMPQVSVSQRQQRRVVAVADERLGGAAKPARVEQRQQLHAAVSAAGGDERGDAGSCPGRRGAPRRATSRRARCVARRARRRVSCEHRLETEARNSCHAGLELVRATGTGWPAPRRRSGRPACKGPRLPHAAHGEPRHLGGDRLVLVAPEQSRAARRRPAARRRRRQETLLDAAVPRERVLDTLERQVPSSTARMTASIARAWRSWLVAAHQHGIAPGGDRPDGGLRHP